jgi:tyrosinase
MAKKTMSKSNDDNRSDSNMKRELEELLLANLPILSRSMTFSKMLQMDKSAASIIRKWPWFFPLLCNRKDQGALTDIEKSRYICAFNMINSDGTLGKLVDLHSGMYMQHTNLRLLPWHRIFVMLFEEALHNYHPDVCVPYWDWTKPGEQHFPDWLAGVLPTVVTPTRTVNVFRSPGAESWLAGIVSGVPSALAQTTYDTFSSPINGIHGGVHIWVGGTMSDAAVSPADPVFWLHHANLDRLWWVWYNSAAGNHQNPALPGLLSPWTYTETDTRNIISLGYKYV